MCLLELGSRFSRDTIKGDLREDLREEKLFAYNYTVVQIKVP